MQIAMVGLGRMLLRRYKCLIARESGAMLHTYAPLAKLRTLARTL